MKKQVIIFIGIILSQFCFARQAEHYQVSSPDERLKLEVQTGRKLYYQVSFQGQVILSYSPISLTTSKKILGANPKVTESEISTHQKEITPIYGTTATIDDHYNQMVIKLQDGLTAVFRVYNQGAAYRLQINENGPLKVYDEEVMYKFPGYAQAWIPQAEGYETTWQFQAVFEAGKQKKLPLPLLTVPAPGNNIKMAITEADVQHYPSLFLQKTDDFEVQLKGVFEKFPLQTQQGGFNNFMQVVSQTADYIALWEHKKQTPWRVLIVSDNDKNLLHNTLVYQLAPANQLKDTDWIEPGQVSWDWWHDYNLDNVDFKTGINTETYLYHIDFAAEYGIPYINVDWKWTDAHDIFLQNPAVDIVRIVDYAKEKGVKVFVWTVSFTLYEQLEEALDLFAQWGIAGVKIDFFGRDDQLANQMYTKIAKEAAQRKLLVNFHGCAKPSGLERTYPNIINYEAVKGLENSKWNETITPDHDAQIPFIRQLAGPMDYTPGAMRNYTKGKFKVPYPPGSQGTRAHQLAMFVVYYQPLVMLCDMPTAYQKEPAYTRLLTSIPSTWDESIPLAGQVGEFAVIARRSGSSWYVGALGNWQERQLDLELSFLPAGEYQATVVVDNINANKLAWSYNMRQMKVDNTSQFKLSLKQGGGAFIKLDKIH